MSQIAVLATAISPLHADLIIVRLRRAGIPVGSISAMYAHTCGPTSALTWLSGPTRFPLLLEKKAFVSGPLRADLSDAGADGDSLAERLFALGVPSEHCTAFGASLAAHRIILCVPSSDDVSLESIIGSFRVTDAESILIAEIGIEDPAEAKVAALGAVA